MGHSDRLTLQRRVSKPHGVIMPTNAAILEQTSTLRCAANAKGASLPAKILVTTEKGGTQVALIGRSGKRLMASEVFREPRAKGATVRALKGLLGSQVIVEDNTLTPRGTSTAKRALNGKAPAPARPRGRKSASPAKRSSASRARRQSETDTVPARSGARRSRRPANKSTG